MLLTLKNHLSFLSVLAVWVVSGRINQYLGVVVVLFTLILFFKKERYYEALLGFFVLLIFSDSFEAMFKFSQTAKPIYLIMLTFLTFRLPGFLEKNYNILIRFTPFLFFALIGIAFSPIPAVSAQKLLSYGLVLFTVPNLLMYEYRRYGNELLVTLVSVSFLIFVISFLLAIFLPEVGISHGGRWRGIMGNPNGLGLLLIVYYILFRVVSNRAPEFFSKLDLRLFYFVAFALVWKSGSRNALLAIIIFELAVAGFKYSKPITILLLATIIIYFEFILTFSLSLITSLGLGNELRLETLDEGSGRLVAWQFAYQEIQKGMVVLGKGMGFDEYVMAKNADKLSIMGHQGGVHNTYLIIWLNTGLAGLVAFFIAFLSFFMEAVKKNRLAFGTMLAVLSSINQEPWLSASLNPFTVIFLVTLVVFLYLDDIDAESIELMPAT